MVTFLQDLIQFVLNQILDKRRHTCKFQSDSDVTSISLEKCCLVLSQQSHCALCKKASQFIFAPVSWENNESLGATSP
jgi:hypothetical protein